MLFYYRHIKKNELGILYRSGEIYQILDPGKHLIHGLFKGQTIDVVDTSMPRIEKRLGDYLYAFRQDIIEQYIEVINITNEQIALRYMDHRLAEVVLPNQRLFYWKNQFNQHFEIVNLRERVVIPEAVSKTLYASFTAFNPAFYLNNVIDNLIYNARGETLKGLHKIEELEDLTSQALNAKPKLERMAESGGDEELGIDEESEEEFKKSVDEGKASQSNISERYDHLWEQMREDINRSDDPTRAIAKGFLRRFWEGLSQENRAPNAEKEGFWQRFRFKLGKNERTSINSAYSLGYENFKEHEIRGLIDLLYGETGEGYALAILGDVIIDIVGPDEIRAYTNQCGIVLFEYFYPEKDQQRPPSKYENALYRFYQKYPDIVARYASFVHLESNQFALRYESSFITMILAPSTKHFFFHSLKKHETRTFELDKGYIIPHDIARNIKPYLKDVAFEKTFSRHFSLVAPVDNEIALVWINHRLESVIESHQVVGYFRETIEFKSEVIDLLDHCVDLDLACDLRHYYPKIIERYCLELNLEKNEIGLLYERDKLVAILPPSSQNLFWKNAKNYHFETIAINDYDDYVVPERIMCQIHNFGDEIEGREWIFQAVIPENHKGVLLVNDQPVMIIDGGHFEYWNINYDYRIEIFDPRPRMISVESDLLCTKDRQQISLYYRVKWQYCDFINALRHNDAPDAYIKNSVQAVIQAWVAQYRLDQFLLEMYRLNSMVDEDLAQALREKGVEITAIHFDSIDYSEVIQKALIELYKAEKKREQAAIEHEIDIDHSRSLLSQAKILEESSLAMHLRELELLPSIIENIDEVRLDSDRGLTQLLSLLQKRERSE